MTGFLPENPLIVQGDHTLLVEVDSPRYSEARDRLAPFAELVKSRQVEASATAYMGDDVVDLPVLRRCGLSISVPDAPVFVRRHVDYVTRAAGGRGAVREACELIMQAQGTLLPALENYLK